MTFASFRRQIGSIAFALSAAGLAVQPVLAAPAMSRGQQDIAISYEACLQRARAAFERNGWGNISGGAGASYVSAFKGIHASYITCNPGPNGMMVINIFVASDAQDGNVPGVERVALQQAMAGAIAQTGGLRVEQLGGGDVRVYWQGKPGNQQDWITVVPSTTPTGNAGSYRWASSPSGSVDFGPLTPGDYEARFYLNNTYAVQDSLPFTIAFATTGLRVDKYGDRRVRVSWQGKPGGAQDWITVVAVDTPMGNAGPWMWATQTSGSVDYGPLDPGTYQARFFYNNNYDLKDAATFSIP